MATKKSTQEFVPIQEIRDGIAILKDGSMRAIIMTSSINFGLKSEEERESLLYQFQNFLNSLNFSVQIVVQSRKLDISPYISLLENRMKEQVNELIKIQTKEYIEFVRKFTDERNIMTKTFLVIVPYSGGNLAATTKGKRGLFGKKKEDKKAKSEAFEEARAQIEQRIDVVEQGLIRSGIRIVKLDTDEMIELFYKLFNPGQTESKIEITQ